MLRFRILKSRYRSDVEAWYCITATHVGRHAGDTGVTGAGRDQVPAMPIPEPLRRGSGEHG
ncbi:hypothetical protein D3C81_1996320 [compost metagenome]